MRMKFLHKLKGDRSATLPVRSSFKSVALVGIGIFLAISIMSCLAVYTHQYWLLGSFGATCLLLFAYPDAVFSQPRCMIMGHLLSSFCALLVFNTCGFDWWALSLALTVSIAAMMLTATVHPPAASNPIIIYLSHPGWSFLVFPILSGSIVLLLIALVYNNLTRQTGYPRYW
jgi:CBS-domain-containing membrane protein